MTTTRRPFIRRRRGGDRGPIQNCRLALHEETPESALDQLEELRLAVGASDVVVDHNHLAVLVENRRRKEVNHVPTDLGGRAENLQHEALVPLFSVVRGADGHLKVLVGVPGRQRLVQSARGAVAEKTVAPKVVDAVRERDAERSCVQLGSCDPRALCLHHAACHQALDDVRGDSGSAKLLEDPHDIAEVILRLAHRLAQRLGAQGRRQGAGQGGAQALQQSLAGADHHAVHALRQDSQRMVHLVVILALNQRPDAALRRHVQVGAVRLRECEHRRKLALLQGQHHLRHVRRRAAAVVSAVQQLHAPLRGVDHLVVSVVHLAKSHRIRRRGGVQGHATALHVLSVDGGLWLHHHLAQPIGSAGRGEPTRNSAAPATAATAATAAGDRGRRC